MPGSPSNESSALWDRGLGALGVKAAAGRHVGTVLVVDDEPDILDTLSVHLGIALRDVGVVCAADGAAALEQLAKNDVDVVVSDFRMPGMDGIELLRQVRLKRPGVVRIMLTAQNDLALAKRAVNEEHVHAFLTKPVEPDEVVRQVADALLESLRGKLRDRLASMQDKVVQDVIALLRKRSASVPP